MIYQVFHKEELFKVCIKDNARIRPIGVGPAVSFCEKNGILSDFSGRDNISHLNHLLSEWSAIYWIWRNMNQISDSDSWVGICHYRRPPASALMADNCQVVGSILDKCDMLSWVPNYNSLAGQSQKDHPGLIELMASAISTCHGEKSARKFLAMSGIPTFNPYSLCFIMKKESFAGFAAWSWKVIDLLVYASSTEESVMAGFDTKAPRGIGYIAERLLPVWCFLNKINVLYTISGAYPSLGQMVDSKLMEAECAMSS